MSGRCLPRAFFVVAALDGMLFGVMALGVPMHIEALHRSASLAGEVLATCTIAVAGGALLAGATGRVAGGGRNMLAAGLAVSGLGEAVLVAASTAPPMLAGAALIGAGIGLFWVASQTLLGQASGRDGSEHAFAIHYASYTLGVAGGSTAAGLVIAALRDAGLGAAAATRGGYTLGVAAAVVALVLWPLGRREPVGDTPRPRLGAGLSPRGVAIQTPDLLLVAALALLLPLAPIVLAGRFHMAPVLVGIAVGGVQAGKIGGALVGRVLSRTGGHRRAILLLLGAAAISSILLAASVFVGRAALFVLVLLATAFVATGAWPLIVDSALARTEPSRRPSATIAWNVCEYGVIAAATVSSGWILAAAGSPQVLFVLAALLLGAAAFCASVVLRFPVHAPEM
jgi:MFS family permease